MVSNEPPEKEPEDELAFYRKRFETHRDSIMLADAISQLVVVIPRIVAEWSEKQKSPTQPTALPLDSPRKYVVGDSTIGFYRKRIEFHEKRLQELKQGDTAE